MRIYWSKPIRFWAKRSSPKHSSSKPQPHYGKGSRLMITLGIATTALFMA
jgi:hypothetical protein